MPYAGSRTTSVHTWLLAEDEDEVDAALRQRFPEIGWLCSHPGPLYLHTVHLHATLALALACGGTQAFIPLPLGARPPQIVRIADGLAVPTGPPVVAEIQLLRSSYHHEHDGAYCTCPGHEHPYGGAYFRAGSLAVRWFEGDVGEEMHQNLSLHTRGGFAALKSATQPARIVNRQSGKPLTGCRIGRAALAATQRVGIPLARLGMERFSLA